MDRSSIVVCMCGALFIATTFVNKYVLSELQFTYPTIFQGWQTLVGAAMLKIMMSSGYMKPLLTDCSRVDLGFWLPGMILFVTSIYSGSKALANLPIPVYLALQNIVLIFKSTADIAVNRQMTSIFVYIMLMMTLVSSIAVAKTDPQFNQSGYLWISVHIISLGLLKIYSKFMKGRLKLNSTEQLYTSYIYSVIVLAPSSYFLGDALEARKFPYFYFSKFYVGCILSGVCGIFLSLTSIKLQEERKVINTDVDAVEALSKILTSLLSLVLFPIQLTANHAIWLLVNHLSAVACSETLTIKKSVFVSTHASTTLEEEEEDIPRFLQRDALQQDMIRHDV